MFTIHLFHFDPTLAISTQVFVLMLNDVYVQMKWRQFEVPDASESSQEPYRLRVWAVY